MKHPPLPRARPLRQHLALLVLGTLLPLVVFSTLVVLRLASEQRDAALRRLSHSSLLMGESVEQEFSSTIRTLEALAGSDRLDRNDLKAFWAEASRARSTQPTWLAIMLVAPSGQQLLTTVRPYGTPLPHIAEMESLRRLLKTGEPTVGTLARGRVTGLWAFPVRVPVRRNGKIRFVLTAAITPEALTQAVVRRLPVGEEWTRTVLDSNHVVVARTRNPEQFIGHSATPRLLNRLRTTDEGVFRNTAIDGVPVYAAYYRTHQAHWVTIVAAETTAIDGPVTAWLAAMAGAAVAVLLLSGAGAYGLSRRLSHGIGSAAKAASALAHGQSPVMSPSSVCEIVGLSDALDRSSKLLVQRAAERDEHLARADEAREQAESANRAKDEFLAMLGHELRNPLSPIITSLELLRMRGAGEGREWKIIDRQTRHMATLVEDLLDVSRITRGKIELVRTPLEISTIAASAVEMTAPLIAEFQHTLTVDVAEHGLCVEGEAPRLTQVLTNLLTNAARYTPPGGRIELAARRDGAWVELTVRDTGQGLPPELLPQIFEVFTQGPRSPDRQQGGLGLGLAIVRNLVLLHGGTVTAASDGPGKGSTFTVRLPAVEPAKSVE